MFSPNPTEQNMDINNNAPSALDNFRYPLEQQLLEIMRSDLQSGDTLRGKCSPASNDCGMSNRGMARRRGKSPFFTSSDQELLGGLDGSNQCKHLLHFLEMFSLCFCLRSNSPLIRSAAFPFPSPTQLESPPSASVGKFSWAAYRRTSTKKRSRPVSDASERWQSTGRTRRKARYLLMIWL